MAAEAIQAISDADAGPQGIATASPPMTYAEMACLAARFNPRFEGNASCMLPPAYGRYSAGGVAFVPVQVPIIFHCLRYLDESGTLQPPYWEPQRDASNLVREANRLFAGTSVTFILQEVRTDPAAHPYLLLDGGLQAFQACTIGPPQPPGPCIAALAAAHSGAPRAVDVFVSGSNNSPLTRCDVVPLDDEGMLPPFCSLQFGGFSAAAGPWDSLPDAAWAEGDAASNWVWVMYDAKDPATLNGERFLDDGAGYLAHELGHWAGLLHTHNGYCEGEGLTVADDVPDTPANKDLLRAYDAATLSALAKFCQDWRLGRPTNTSELLRFDSCGGGGGGAGAAAALDSARVDNVFNVMSYPPTGCRMVVTENQAARMQWALATFRPRGMARWAV